MGSWLWVWGRDTRDVTGRAGTPSAPTFPFSSSSSRVPFQDGTPGLSWGQPDLTDLQPDLCPLATHCRGHAPKVWPLPKTLALSQRACKGLADTYWGALGGTTRSHKTACHSASWEGRSALPKPSSSPPSGLSPWGPKPCESPHPPCMEMPGPCCDHTKLSLEKVATENHLTSTQMVSPWTVLSCLVGHRDTL